MTWPIIITALIAADVVLQIAGIGSSHGFIAGVLIALLVLSEVLQGWRDGNKDDL